MGGKKPLSSNIVVDLQLPADAGNTGRPPAVSSASTTSGPVLCGRGNKKTRRRKRFRGSYGNARPKNEKKVERIKVKVEYLVWCVIGWLLLVLQPH